MEGLRKQVSESHGLNRVSRIDQHSQVTRERCWIAGNVDQSRRCNVDKLRSDLSTQSTSWWIDNNQVRSSSPVLRSEKRKCFRLHGFASCSVQILFECCRRRGCRLDRNYTLKVRSKSPSKQSNTGKQIPSQPPLWPPATRSTSSSTSQRFTWKKAPWSTR